VGNGSDAYRASPPSARRTISSNITWDIGERWVTPYPRGLGRKGVGVLNFPPVLLFGE
jgi:hypothetical protein